jgi:diguanylate cyclase (GGDEF)-like protein
MKKIDTIKTIQLVLFLVIAALSAVVIILRGGSRHSVILLLWGTLALSFLFIFLDFSLFAEQQQAYENMLKALNADPVSKIANRRSIDALLDKFDGQTLPTDFACIAFELTNIKAINQQYGRSGGNEALKRFSITLNLAALDNFFVARNGGSRFAAMSEDLSREDIAAFLKRIDDKIAQYNHQLGHPPIHYTVGAAFNDPAQRQDIVTLIATANRRLNPADERHTLSADDQEDAHV